MSHSHSLWLSRAYDHLFTTKAPMNHAGTSIAPAQPVIGALNALDRSAADLHECIGELERRLEAVLRPLLPEAAAPAPAGYAPGRTDAPQMPQSRVTQEVMAAASSMERAHNRISALMTRMEV
jgi:hypothetical protein